MPKRPGWLPTNSFRRPPSLSHRERSPFHRTNLSSVISSACLIDGTMRLASSGTNAARNATWPTKFEAPASGTYDVTVSASMVPSEELKSGTLRVGSMNSFKSSIKMAKDVSVSPGEPQSFQFQMTMDRGETVVMRYHDGPLNYEDKVKYKSFLTELFQREPRLAAAWDAVGNPARGGSGWQRVLEKLDDEALDVKPFLKPEKIEKLVASVSKNSVSSGETLVYKFFSRGTGDRNQWGHHRRSQKKSCPAPIKNAL